jgi:phospholipid/cholesterol/gamma-HCH transport system substrate-binding protein
MDLHYRREATVGALVVIGILVFVVGTMWLSGRSLDTRRDIVRVQFADVGNLKRGNPVKVSGVTLGNVQEIRFRDVGNVEVLLSLDPRIEPRADATATLTAVGLVGDVAINFDPGTSTDPLPTGQAIPGSTEQGLAALGTGLAGQAGDVMEGMKAVVNQRLADDLHQTLASFQRLANTFGNDRRGPTAELTATMVELRSLSRRMDSILAGGVVERALANADTLTVKLGTLTDQFSGTAVRLDSLLARVNRGEGTLGRFATDTTLFVELSALSASLKEFVDDLKKNPGKLSIQFKLF